MANPEMADEYSAEVRGSGWLGYGPATEQAIREAEARLGTALPPSLRAFYQVSNGWRHVGPCIWAIPSIEKLAWLKEDQPWLWELAADLAPNQPQIVSEE